MKIKFYAAKSEGVGLGNCWAVWQRIGRNRVQVCVVTYGGRKEARQIAEYMNSSVVEP